MKRIDDPTTNLLWTGGWDSTFRLLQLLFDGRGVVQPWYLLDEERASAPHELEAMERIRAALDELLPGERGRFLPTRVIDVSSLDKAPELTDMASGLKLGSQYEWLARFAREYELEGLELSVEDRPGRVQAMLRPLLEESSGTQFSFRIAPERLSRPRTNPDLALFSAFSFPLLGITKREMLEEARSRGWDSLLAQTWFCHTPKDERPCGSCTPCLVVIEEGFSSRIPPLRRVRPRLRLFKRRIERLLRPEESGLSATSKDVAEVVRHLSRQAERG